MVVEESGGIVCKFALLDSATTDEMIGSLQELHGDREISCY